MAGFSGFGNSPLKDTDPHTSGHTHNDGSREAPKAGMLGSHVYYEKGYTDKKPKRSKHRKAFKYTRVGKFFGLHKIKSGKHQRSGPKISCGPRGCN